MTNKTKRIALWFILPAFWACDTAKTYKSIGENPFYQEYTTPYGVPPFNEIQIAHFEPALKEGIRQHQQEIDSIAAIAGDPAFENTVLALEKSGKLLNRVQTVFGNLNGTHTNDTLQQIAKDMAPLLSEHNDNINLNKPLFERVKKVWDNREQAGLNPEQLKLLEKRYKAFVRSGANLSDTDQDKLRKINAELSVLTLQFGQNLLAETNNWELVIEDRNDLSGLPQELITTAANEATAAGKEGKWIFKLQNASIMPFLQYADNRNLRKRIWEAYMMRSNNGNEFDNKEIVRKMVNLRRERANLLGYPTHAHYVLEESMAKNPDNVYKLLNQLWEPALRKAKQEAADLRQEAAETGTGVKIEPYDWRYYTDRIRKKRYNLDEQELKPYFSLDNVREGIFLVTNKLYGITFKEVTNIPKYHPEVVAYEAFDTDGSSLGLIYMDFFPRASKRGGAWMTSYRRQYMDNGKRVAPVISIVCNFSKPVGDDPALLTFDENTTFFHEFGHALHGLLSNVTYESLAGTAVSRDFVELPSQVMENWAADPEVLKLYAKHYKTGETIPDELITKLQNTGTFDQGFATTEYLAASLLDMDYHTRMEELGNDINAFEKESMQRIGLIDGIIPRYRSTYFQHIFASGYSAGYYSYIWSGVLDTDAFAAFKETSLFNQEKAAAFRKHILERGGTGDPAEQYRQFRGADPKIDALLKKRGLN